MSESVIDVLGALKGCTGIKIVVSDYIKDDTIVISKGMYERLKAGSKPFHTCTDGPCRYYDSMYDKCWCANPDAGVLTGRCITWRK